MDKTIITNTSEETKKIAQNLAQNLGNTRFLALFGELGSGKTTFVQGFAKGLGLKERIISPTFIIVRSYELEVMSFYHIDLYRVQNSNELEGLGLKEIFNDQKNIVAVEWAEKIKELLPPKRVEIYFENIGDEKRKITFKTYE